MTQRRSCFPAADLWEGVEGRGEACLVPAREMWVRDSRGQIDSDISSRLRYLSFVVFILGKQKKADAKGTGREHLALFLP